MITAHPTCRNHSTSSSLFWGEEFTTFFGDHIWVWGVVFFLFLFLYIEVLTKISKIGRIYTKEPKFSQISLSENCEISPGKKRRWGGGFGRVMISRRQSGQIQRRKPVHRAPGHRPLLCRGVQNAQEWPNAVIRSQSARLWRSHFRRFNFSKKS